MRKIQVHWEYHGIAGASGSDIIEVEDNATDEQIEDIVTDRVLGNEFSFGWEDA